MSRVSPAVMLLVLSCGTATHSEVAAATAPLSASSTAADAPADPTGEAAAAVALDSAAFDKLLAKHVRNGLVDYAALKADATAQKQLDDFLAAVARMPETAPLSAWLNAYNALVIKLVLERYPLKSVMDVPDFFKALDKPVAGKARSLDEIEHSIIRPRFKDARVHVALNCGAMSCPALRDRAFVEATLEADLDTLSRRAVDDPRHVRLHEGKLELSAIFFWFEDDFVRDAGSVVGWIKRHATSKALRGMPAGIERAKLEYDWTLADAAQRH